MNQNTRFSLHYKYSLAENFRALYRIGCLRWNGTIYQVDWSDLQLSITDLTLANTSFIDNVGEAEVRGLDTNLAFVVTDQLTLFASVAYNDTELTSAPATVTNLVPEGSPLAFSPELQYNIRARYTWQPFSDYVAHAQLAIQYADSSANSIITANNTKIPNWTTADATVGLSNGEYSLEFYANNLTDENVIRSIDQQGSNPEEFVTRPRTLGLRLSYDF